MVFMIDVWSSIMWLLEFLWMFCCLTCGLYSSKSDSRRATQDRTWCTLVMEFVPELPSCSSHAQFSMKPLFPLLGFLNTNHDVHQWWVRSITHNSSHSRVRNPKCAVRLQVFFYNYFDWLDLAEHNSSPGCARSCDKEPYFRQLMIRSSSCWLLCWNPFILRHYRT